jgi:hypothetical protein
MPNIESIRAVCAALRPRFASSRRRGAGLAALGVFVMLTAAVTAVGPGLWAAEEAPAVPAAAPTPAAETATPAAEAATPAAEAATPTDDAAPAPPSPPAAATDAAASDAAVPGTEAVDTRGLDTQVQDLKKEVVDLNKELFVLEEELLFPANTQVAVFLSMDVGSFFALDTVELKVDNKEVANYLYTPREAEALLKGGVHRLYLGNLKAGQHELVAFFSGKGPGAGANDRDYRRGASVKFEKAVGAKYLELKITDRQRKAQPEFEIKDWD